MSLEDRIETLERQILDLDAARRIPEFTIGDENGYGDVCSRCARCKTTGGWVGYGHGEEPRKYTCVYFDASGISVGGNGRCGAFSACEVAK